MSPTTFIYALCEPGTRKVRYIGKSNNPTRRFKEHLRLSSQAKTHLGCWLRLVLSAGETPAVVVLREVPEEHWGSAEERYIRLARGLGMKLVNGTDGGEGLHNPAPEVRANMSAALKGKKHSTEHCTNISAALKGKKHSAEHRANVSAAQRLPEVRAKKSAAQTGRKHSAESRANSSAARVSHNQFRRMPWFSNGGGI